MAFWPLPFALVLLMLDAIIEVGFVGSMVGYLHHDHAGIPFAIQGPDQIIQLDPKPVHLIVNQGHTSNGAAGTALMLVGVAGFLVLQRQRYRERSNMTHRASPLFLIWTIFTFLSFLLTLSALIYTFVVTNQTKNQIISLSIAAANSGLPYPENQWTPENWYKQVLTLPFVDASQKNDVRLHVHLMEGWRWNLIPLLVLGLLVCGLAGWSLARDRQPSRSSNRESGAYLRDKEGT